MFFALFYYKDVACHGALEWPLEKIDLVLSFTPPSATQNELNNFPAFRKTVLTKEFFVFSIVSHILYTTLEKAFGENVFELF